MNVLRLWLDGEAAEGVYLAGSFLPAPRGRIQSNKLATATCGIYPRKPARSDGARPSGGPRRARGTGGAERLRRGEARGRGGCVRRRCGLRKDEGLRSPRRS